jgi:hypothetical protein
MTQPEIARSIRVSLVTLVAGFAMLVAAVIAFIAHAVAVGDVFLTLMVVFGVIGFAAAVRSRSRARALARTRQEERRANVGDGFRKPLR